MNRTRQRPLRNEQSGVVLVIGMLLLVMTMLIAISIVRLSGRHTQVVNNEQVRTEAGVAANYALDLVMNEPATTWTDLKGSTGRVEQVNLGTLASADTVAASVGVTVNNLVCKRARVIKNSELVKLSGGVSYVAAEDTSCFGGASNTGLTIIDTNAVGSASGNSNCGSVLYDMQATAADVKLLNASARVVQGVEVRTDISTLNSSCS